MNGGDMDTSDSKDDTGNDSYNQIEVITLMRHLFIEHFNGWLDGSFKKPVPRLGSLIYVVWNLYMKTYTMILAVNRDAVQVWCLW